LAVFQGAPWPREGEPLYTQEDHDWFVALAEERRDTCPACGLLKAVCRDKARQFDFVVVEDQCNATRALADHQEAKKDRNVSQQRSMQVSIAFREGKSPPLDVGLDLVEVGADDVAAGPDGA
jgi:hypothetical protein